MPTAPFDILGNLEIQFITTVRDPMVMGGFVPWLPQLRHKALILFTLWEIHVSPNRPVTYKWEYVMESYARLLAWIDQDLAQIASPDVAQRVRRSLDDVFSMVPVKM
ncbi:hypothetical protein JCM11641_000803 [Rhodosporidiobolus odoratus]